MGRYIVLPIARDPAEAEEQALEVMQTQFPSWGPREADPMTLVLRSVAVLYSDVAELATRMGEEAFRYFGRGVANLPPVDELPAVGTVTITAQNAAGPYVVPEGLELVGRGELGEAVGFRTVAEAVIPNGSTTVNVDVEASEAGEAGNGVGGVAEFSEFVDYLTAVAFVGTTSGGADREGDEPFLDRLGDEFEISNPRPVLPKHFAVLARRFGAYRATVIDGLDPTAAGGAGTTGNTATVTVAGIDEAGNPLPGALKTSIAAQLDAMREVGWRVFLIDPAYTLIDAAFTATAYPDWDPVAVHDAAIESLTLKFSPTTHGAREDTGEVREWLNDPKVRFLEASDALQRVEGLNHVDSLTIAKQGTALAGLDVTMTGFAPLPKPGNITGTVAAG